MKNVGCEYVLQGVEKQNGASCNQHAGAGAEHPKICLQHTREEEGDRTGEEYGKLTKEILFLRLASVEFALESKKNQKRGDLGSYQNTKPRRKNVCFIFPLFF